MLLFFRTKRKRFVSRLLKAFPSEYAADVEAVCDTLKIKSEAYDGSLYSEASTKWRLPTGETVDIPYRIYVREEEDQGNKLTPRQRAVYRCIFSRSYDGYVRQKHIEALLDSELFDGALPYVVKVCDEYVTEILESVYQRLSDRGCEEYKELCELNFDYIKLAHARMISYWNENCRYDCYRYKDYVGKKLYRDCFGYGKTGQKRIER